MTEPTDNRYTVSLTTGPCPLWDVEELLLQIAALTKFTSTGSGAIRADVYLEESA